MKRFILIFLFIVTLLLIPISSGSADNMPVPPKESREELYHDMFISLLLPNINQFIDDYYSKMFTRLPTIYTYMVDITDVKRVNGYRSFSFLVTLEIIPVVGPHISVGKDRLTYEIGAKAVLFEHEHLETHELPEHWKHIIK
ncbi:DUF3888 domain-containing protein [Ornithinibacillus sp. L9]|uniref:DUF3888 domain-containing protein n=1 Tax=Ornithinibacillus caprae TaxID=2678566 RepID=A0A6N8FM10_9BACI|nr:DUF3888 domain-containing protein [Ornithinibacillus caprae]MUK90515.1 DUF3888 domain-containing protein [Ornithinibacillus caprae]